MSLEDGFHVVMILGRQPSTDGSGTEFKLVSRYGAVFWATVEGRFEPSELLDVAILRVEGGRPSGIEFHTRNADSKSRTAARKVIGYRQ